MQQPKKTKLKERLTKTGLSLPWVNEASTETLIKLVNDETMYVEGSLGDIWRKHARKELASRTKLGRVLE